MARKTQTEDTAVAVAEPKTTTLAQSGAYDTRGKENIESDDVIVPRLQVAQKTSAVLDPSRESFIEGLKLGEMYNSVTSETYGSGPVRVVFVSFRKYGMLFDDQSRLVEANLDPSDDRLKFGRDASGRPTRPQATLFYEFLALTAETLEPVFVTFKGVGIRTAKQINAHLRKATGAAWTVAFDLTSGIKTSGAYTFGAMNARYVGPADPNVIEAAEGLYEALAAGNVAAAESSPETPQQADDDVPF